jgi:hypothetical protein
MVAFTMIVVSEAHSLARRSEEQSKKEKGNVEKPGNNGRTNQACTPHGRNLDGLMGCHTTDGDNGKQMGRCGF